MFCAFEKPGLVQLPDKLIDAFTAIAGRAHLLEESRPVLGSVTGHRELERAQECGDLLEMLPRECNFMDEVLQANDTKSP